MINKLDTAVFKQDVYNIVAQIPQGCVVTYGDIARLSGWPLHSRLVGKVLSEVPDELELPCHRVVNCQGRLSPVFHEQQERLETEGHCSHCRWKSEFEKISFEV